MLSRKCSWVLDNTCGYRYASGVAGRCQMDSNGVLDAQAVAEMLGANCGTVARLAKAGRLPGRKVGMQRRFARLALLRYLSGEWSEDRREAVGE